MGRCDWGGGDGFGVSPKPTVSWAGSCEMGGDRDSQRRDDAGERVTIPNEGKRRDEVISCCDVILINYIENSMYYNT